VETEYATAPSTPPEPPVAPVPTRVRLSAQLDEMAASLQDRPLSFGEVVEITQGRAYDLLLILLAVPFLSPVPIPFLSTFLGTVIALIGIRLSLGLKPWLPKRVLDRKIHAGIILRILKAGSAMMRRMEKLLRPRLGFVHRVVFFQRVAGALIAVSGLLLLLPLPIPLSNFFPAFTVLLLAAGALERDGAFFIAGCVAFVITLIFFGAIAFGGMEAIQWIRGFLPEWGEDPEAAYLVDPDDLGG
jgi:hypothetical protein